MSMFCFQCQETAGCSGCTVVGVCGKNEEVAKIQDLLIFVTKGLATVINEGRKIGVLDKALNRVIIDNLFITITNANFDFKAIEEKVKNTLNLREDLRRKIELKGGNSKGENFKECATWNFKNSEDMMKKASQVGVLSTENEDIRSLRELIMYGLKGLAAYVEHAMNLGHDKEEIHEFISETLVKTLDDSLSLEELINLSLKTGEFGVLGMKLLDEANTLSYGHPEMTKVNIGVRKNKGILISGHDLKDLEMLLEQTEGTGIDVYTHGEMLPGHYYPKFKKYSHFVGNYGNAWWLQNKEFESFNGPILMTTNCIIKVKDSYKDRIFTTGAVGYEGCSHIEADENGYKNFSQIIDLAKTCKEPEEIESGEIIGGFAHNQVNFLIDKVVKAVKEGEIKRFFVMAGCDGRSKSRDYYREFAEKLPKNTVILTAGCAKYRYNKLPLGDINGIPRVLDAGQCNDSYSLVMIALKLAEEFGLDSINKLPISYNIAWYEQKAVIVLLSLLYLGVKNIHLGPTIPAFLSPNITNILVKNFGIAGITSVEEDMKIFFKE